MDLIKSFCIAIIFLGLISCNHSKEKLLESNSLPNQLKNVLDTVADDNYGLLNFEFPDTVKLGTETRGTLQYDLTLNDSLSEKLQDRFTFLYVTKDYVEGGSKEIEKGIHTIYKDTIGDGNYIFEVAFEDIGEHIFSLAIEDHLILEPDIDTVAINYGRSEVLIWHRVIVK